MKFFYTIFINRGKEVCDVSGVFQAESIDDARQKLAALGLTVKEVRVATQNEIYIENLKKFRRKLTGDTKPIQTSEPTQMSESRSYSFEILIFLIVVLVVLLHCLWGLR